MGSTATKESVRIEKKTPEKKKKPAGKSQKLSKDKIEGKISKIVDKSEKDVLKEADMNVEILVECKIERDEDEETEKSGQIEQMDTQNDSSMTILVKSEKMEEDEENRKAEVEDKDGKKESKNFKGSDSGGKIEVRLNCFGAQGAKNEGLRRFI